MVLRGLPVSRIGELCQQEENAQRARVCIGMERDKMKKKMVGWQIIEMRLGPQIGELLTLASYRAQLTSPQLAYGSYLLNSRPISKVGLNILCISKLLKLPYKVQNVLLSKN